MTAEDWTGTLYRLAVWTKLAVGSFENMEVIKEDRFA
jgi:hypothetical protein